MAATGSGELGARIAYVDGLRAIAVLLVVASHAAKWDPKLSQGVLLHGFLEGTHGVDLFFVLSGFCLSYPLLRALHLRGTSRIDVAGYLARRIVRIVPPYYFAIAVVGLGILALRHVGWEMPDVFGVSQVGWFDVGKQAVFADRQPRFLNPSFWTLAIEWRWYFLFPVLLVLWIRSARAFILVAICCALAAALTRAGSFDLLALPAFMLGIAAADIELRGAAVGRLAVLLCILSLCVAVYAEPSYSLGYLLQLQPGWQLAAFFFVLAAGKIPLLRVALSVRPLVWVGVASYSVYLMHEPVIAAIEQNAALNPLVAGVLAVVAGAAFWAVFERPFMTKALKARLVALLAPPIRSFMDFAGVPSMVDLKGTPGSVAQRSDRTRATRAEHAADARG